MSETQRPQTAEASDDLFDRYTLPKIALSIILVASLLGVWLTTTLSGDSLVTALAKWAYFVALGILTGGFVWKHWFVRPDDLGTDAAEYCAAMYDRFDRIAAGAVTVLALAGIVVVGEYVATFGPTPAVYGFGAIFATCITLVAVTATRTADVTAQFRSRLGLATLALVLVLVGATAVAEVALRGLVASAVAVRTLHVLAFAMWLGGAVWNIFVAVPTGQRRPTVPVVRAAGEQLERFRWAVRFIIPTLFITGFYQAIDALGTSAGIYLGTTVGLVTIAKAGTIGVLVVIFKLCPMWRACSPIEGVCELDELQGTDSPGASSGPASSAGHVVDSDAEVTSDD
jgi:putative copper resistance protein D